uniref:Uncharacterized protein n=1 Tax=Glossina pallidipes TaxID=7398 RepID=A0A1A9ZUU1_GLOPL
MSMTSKAEIILEKNELRCITLSYRSIEVQNENKFPLYLLVAFTGIEVLIMHIMGNFENGRAHIKGVNKEYIAEEPQSFCTLGCLESNILVTPFRQQCDLIWRKNCRAPQKAFLTTLSDGVTKIRAHNLVVKTSALSQTSKAKPCKNIADRNLNKTYVKA